MPSSQYTPYPAAAGEAAQPGQGGAADTLYRSVVQRDAPGDVEILGLPGQQLAVTLRPGDLLVRVAAGEPGLGRIAALVDGELAAAAVFAARGIIPESTLAGQYAAVVDNGGGAAPSIVARRITDANGYILSSQMLLRSRGQRGSLGESAANGGGRVELESTSAALEEDAGVVELIGLGLAVFSSGRSVLTSGDFKVETAECSYVHPNTPPDRALTKSTMDLTIIAHHPRYFIDDQHFVFHIEFEHNGNDLKMVRITPLRDASSSLYASSFEISFHPSAASQPNDAIAQVRYVIQGEWNPVGRGDVSFQGELDVSADGGAKCNITSEKNWVFIQNGAFTNVRRQALPTPRLDLHVYELFFSPPGSDQVAPPTERATLDWFDKLDPELKRNVKDGAIAVQVHGYASTTGNDTFNRQLARRRAERVQSILRDNLGPNAKIDVYSHGERDAGTPDETESAARRKVRIEIRRYIVPP